MFLLYDHNPVYDHQWKELCVVGLTKKLYILQCDSNPRSSFVFSDPHLGIDHKTSPPKSVNNGIRYWDWGAGSLNWSKDQIISIQFLCQIYTKIRYEKKYSFKSWIFRIKILKLQPFLLKRAHILLGTKAVFKNPSVILIKRVFIAFLYGG